MDIMGQTSRRVILLSLAGMILPLVAFPARFGLDLARPSFVNLAFEVVFYGLVVYLFDRRINLLKLFGTALACVVGRLALGLTFGVLIATLYSMDYGVCINLGLFSYLPAVIPQALVIPFAVMPLAERFRKTKPEIEPEMKAEPVRATTPPAATKPRDVRPKSEAAVNSVAVSRERGVVTESTSLAMGREPVFVEKRPGKRRTPRTTNEWETSGFDKAVTYIGEHASVHLAAVVDYEGLLLGTFTRHQFDAEAWAPLALLLLQNGGEVLRRTGMSDPDRLDMQREGMRVVVARLEGCYLLVVSERHDDDLLNIRVNQGLEMINRFVAERYGDKLNSNAESIHVSSAQ